MKTLQQIIAGRVTEARQHSRDSWQDDKDWREGYRRMKADAMQDARTLRDLASSAGIPRDYRRKAVRDLLTCITAVAACSRLLHADTKAAREAATPDARENWAYMVATSRADLRQWQRHRQTLLAQINEELRCAQARCSACD